MMPILQRLLVLSASHSEHSIKYNAILKNICKITCTNKSRHASTVQCTREIPSNLDSPLVKVNSNNKERHEWDKMYDMLILYKQQFGDFHVQTTICAADLHLVNQTKIHQNINLPQLHAWLKKQRNIIKTKSKRIKKKDIPDHMQKLVPLISLNAHESLWQYRYNQLKLYFNKHGNDDDPLCL